MKIDLTNIDQENFLIHPHEIAGETCYLVQAKHIGVQWTRDNLHLRSSLWNADGELISASFKKFFNWGEHPELAYTPFSLTANGGCQLLEKIDGSTLILSRYKGHNIIRTRGTVDATILDNGHEIEWLKDKYPKVFDMTSDMDHNFSSSLILEWVSPINKIVLNYGDDPDLYLTACISHQDYSLFSQQQLDELAIKLGVKRPAYYNFDKVKEMLEAVEQLKGKEGLCVYCNNGQDIRKVKSAWYLALHRMKSELGSYERVVDFYFTLGNQLGHRPSYQEYYDFVEKNYDFELAEQCRPNISIVCEGIKEVDSLVAAMRAKVEPLRKLSRKDAAAVILQAYGNTNRSGMAFKLLDSKTLDNDDMKKLLYQITKD